MGAVLVLVLWTLCLTVGALGYVLPYAREKVDCKCETAVEFKKLDVDLGQPEPPPPQEATPENAIPTPQDFTQPQPQFDIPLPDAPPTLAAPAPPAVVAVAPSPKIAFAIPVLNPSRVAATPAAASFKTPSSQPQAPSTPGSMAPQALVFGQGEGRQPSPSYPDRARREGQEGTVVVRFVVGPDGAVRSAEAHVPSPWPLLDEEAIRTIRRKWKFEPGEVRLFEVPIRFALTK